MALAYLQLITATGTKFLFRVDTGSNLFFQFRFWKQRPEKGNGPITGYDYESALFRNPKAGESFLPTWTEHAVDHTLVKEYGKYVQMVSYRDQRKSGPAISEIIALGVATNDGPLPKLNVHMPQTLSTYRRTVRAQTYSETTSWGALFSALPGIISKVSPVIQKILPVIKENIPAITGLIQKAGSANPPTTTQNAGTTADANKAQTPPVSEEMLKAILDIVAKLTAPATESKQQSYARAHAINPAVLTQLAPLLEKVMSPETIKAIGDQPVKLFQAIADSALKFNQQELTHLEKLNPGVEQPKDVMDLFKQMCRAPESRYVRAQIAPALLAALPALMPLIEKVLNPETIKAIGDQPVKLLNAIADGALKFSKQELDHLEKINPGVNMEKDAWDLLKSMSAAPAKSYGPPFVFHPAFDITFLDVRMVEIHGRQKVVFDRNVPARFVIRLDIKNKSGAVQSTRTLSQVRFSIVLKDILTLKVLFTKSILLPSVETAMPIRDILLTTEELLALPLHSDIKCELSVCIQSPKTGKKIGTFKNHVFSVTDSVGFAVTGKSSGQVISMSSPDRHRAFWHKVWHKTRSTSPRWESVLLLKYTTQLSLQTAGNTLLPSRVRPEISEESTSQRHKERMKVLSGIQWTLNDMNKFLLAQGMPVLTPAQLNALEYLPFLHESHKEATQTLEFRGRDHEAATLWAYPDVEMMQIRALEPAVTNAAGMVESMREVQFSFPVPVAMNFVGTKSE